MFFRIGFDGHKIPFTFFAEELLTSTGIIVISKAFQLIYFSVDFCCHCEAANLFHNKKSNYGLILARKNLSWNPSRYTTIFPSEEVIESLQGGGL